MDPLPRDFRFEALRIDPAAGRIAGPAGRVQVDPKVMGVLVAMAEGAGEVVSREELHERLWPGQVVTDDALTRCIYELRRHLVQAGGDESYRDLIETLPKRGYRLKVSVRPDAPDAPRPTDSPDARRRRWLAAVATALIAIAAALAWWKPFAPRVVADAEPAIAVMPFLDLSQQEDQQFLADGIAEEILNRLAQSRNLRVIARTSTFALRDESLDIPEIGRRLDVDYVLEGSVRRAGDELRVTAQLIDVADSSHVWSQTYDKELGDLFDIQDEIAASVGSAMQVELGGARRMSQPAAAAYEQFLHGQFLHHRRSPGDIERAIAYYERAVGIDPGFARAWAALAGAYSLMNDREPLNRRFGELQGAAARRAVEADPQLAVAQARMSQYNVRIGQFQLADRHWEKAVALDPDDPLVLGFSSTRAVFRGDLDTAVAIWRRLAARDPLSAITRQNFGLFLLAEGRTSEAVAELRVSAELNPAAGNRLDLARALVLAGRHAEAADLVASLPPGLQRELAFALLIHDARQGPAARAALGRIEVPVSDPEPMIRLAEAHAYRGEAEEAFRLLTAARAECERRLDEAPNLLIYFRKELILAPFLGSLHADARWAPLVARAPQA